MEKRKKKKGLIENSIIFGGLVLFFIILYFIEGLNIPPDAEGYINMVSFREPVYPLFLATFRIISGEFYLWIVGFVQNILLAVSITYFIKQISYVFGLPTLMKIYMIITAIGITLFNKYVVYLEYWFTNGIQSEGISITLWLLFVAFILRFLHKYEEKYFWYATIMAILLFNLRKQLIIGFLIIVVIGIILIIRRKLNKETIIKCLIGTVLSGVVALLVGPFYHLCLNGEFQQYNDTNSAFLTPVFYASDYEMGEKIKDDEIKDLFYELYEMADELKYNYKYSQSGWKNGNNQSVGYYQGVFNPLAFDVLRENIQKYIKEKGIQNTFEKDLEFDRIEGKMAISLMPFSVKNLIDLYFNCVLTGMIHTVAKPQSQLTPLSLILYGLYVILLWLCFKQKKKCSFFGMVMLIIMIINAAVTACFIFPLPRYMIYNMYGFYFMLGIMFYSTFLNDKNRNLHLRRRQKSE